MTEFMQLTDKLQHLTMMLQPFQSPQPNKESVHTTMQAYTDTLHTTQKEANLTTSLLQDISGFDGQDSTKLEDWLMDMETATDILTESHTHLAEAKSNGLTHTLICKTLQAGKCWDELKGILQLKLCNANIHTYTSCFMEIQQKDNGTLIAHVHHFKTAAKLCVFDSDTAAIYILLKDFRMHMPPQL